MRFALALGVLVAFASPARADDPAPGSHPAPGSDPAPDGAPDPPTEGPVAPQRPVPSEPPAATRDPRDDDGWKLYDAAFSALATGDRANATALVRQLLAEHPDHPATAEASALIALLDPPRDAPVGSIVPEQPRKSARAELAIFQTIHGVTAGAELCLLAGCDDGTAALGLALLGGGVGLVGSLLGTSDGITDGQRALANSGTFWGFANAMLATIIADPANEESIFGALLGGQLVGLLVGSGIGRGDNPPRSGQVALANSGGTWLGAIAGLTAVAADDNLDDSVLATTLLIAADVGLVTGGYLASRLPRISRSQTMLYDAGGILGGVIGAGAYVLITNDTGRAAAGFAAAGAAVGLGTAAYLTRRWNVDTDAGSAQAAIVPTRGGALATFSLSI